jgi:hypothetical protein
VLRKTVLLYREVSRHGKERRRMRHGHPQPKRKERSSVSVFIQIRTVKRIHWSIVERLRSMITNNARCTHEIKPRIAIAKSRVQQEEDSFNLQNGPKFMEETVKKLHLEHSCCAGMCTLRKDRKCLESFEMWSWGRTEKIIRSDRVRNEEVLYRIKEVRNNL